MSSDTTNMDTTPPERSARPAEPVKKERQELKPDVSTQLAGETQSFVVNLKPYLPQDLVGGSVPHVPGAEMETVWNAASQACGTEKVHFTFSIYDGRVWYLACPTTSLSSNPDSWCPLAAALPGNSEYWDKETVYLYEQEGVASALRWDPDTGRMQVFLGASRTILPRVQSMDANFVTINAADATIVPWRNKQLRTERLTRATIRVLTLIGAGITVLSVAIIIFSFLTVNLIQRDLNEAKFKTENASMTLMTRATNVMQSDAIKHLVRVQELLDGLTRANGTLVRYEVDKNKVTWEALVPDAFASKFGAPQGIDKDGRTRVRGTK